MGANLITYATEKMQGLQEEITPLMQEQHLVSTPYNLKMNVNWKAYFNLCKADMLKVFTARKDGELVGYLLAFINTHLHYKDHLVACCDMVYVKPEYRKIGTGYYLIQYAEEQLSNIGVSIFGINTRVDRPFDKLMSRMQYNLQERSYSKYIGK